jgi:hypothetical protein
VTDDQDIVERFVHLSRIVWKPPSWEANSAGLPEPERVHGIAVPLEVGRASRLAQAWADPLSGLVNLELLRADDDRLVSEQSIKIPADMVLLLVDSLLYVHRRTHGHYYKGQPWSEDEPRAEP